MATVTGFRIRPGQLEDREYQARISEVAARENTLVVLPTGLGKTAIALRVMDACRQARPDDSILFLAPTRPLVVQHAASIERVLDVPAPVVLTGAISPEKRPELIRPPQVIVATPQVVANDLFAGDFPLDRLSLVVFDEAHRAVGDYPYVAIGRALRDRRVRILAMTASPGARIERVREVWANLGIERFELRGPSDPDVIPYTHAIDVEPVIVHLPADVRHLGTRLRTVVADQIRALQRLGYPLPAGGTRRELLEIGENLDRQIGNARARGEPAPGPIWAARTAQAIAMKAGHAVELVETQGVEGLRQYLERQARDARGRRSPALRGFLSHPDVVAVREQLEGSQVEHPKVEAAVRIVREELARAPGARIILFTQYRQTAERLTEELGRAGGAAVRAVRFVGQASHGEDEGMSQRQQIEILDRFRKGEVNVLVATSVAEEGLDIPSTDLVVLYEPVPDEIRTIQRRGRTGRARAGRALVLIAEGTRDEGMYRAAQSRERKMHEMLERVQAERRTSRAPLPPPPRRTQQSQLEEFTGHAGTAP